MEQASIMVIHALLIGIILFVLMKFVLGQQNDVAERRSILLAACALIYMILFGHGLPTKLNKI